MNNLMNFNFEVKKVRTLLINDEIYFVAKDVADILKYAETSVMLRRLDDDEMKKIEPSVVVGANSMAREFTVINESGLYNAVLGSKKENAKRFKKWVTSEVLPSIRKTGSYSKQLTTAEMLLKQAELMVEHERKLKDVDNRLKKLEDIESKKSDISILLPVAKEKTTRSSINQVVRSYADRNKKSYKDVWDNLYIEFNYRYNMNIHIQSKNRGLTKIEMIEKLDKLDELLSLAVYLYS